MLRFIRQNPILGLLLALSMEAWLGLPGEAMIAVAASTVAQAYGLLRIAVGGVVGMLLNDLILFTLSQAGREGRTHGCGMFGLHWHLSSEMVLGAKFLPPQVKVGDRVFFRDGAGTAIAADGEVLVVMKEADLVSVITKTAARNAA